MDLRQTLFRERVAGALVRVRQILDSTRAPQLPADVAHSYDDKYALAEFLSNAGLAALLNALERVGVDASALRAMLAWAAQHHIVTLRLQCQQTCRFERTDSRDVEASERVVNRTRQGGAPVEQSEVTVVTKVVEHVWDLALQWELLAFAGCDSDGGQRLSLERGVCATKLVTTGEIKQPPRPATRVDQPLDLDLTWLLLQISDELRLQFKIDRAAESCRTPRRNEDVDAAVAFLGSVCTWCTELEKAFSERALCGDRAALAIDKNDLFLPVLPLLEEPGTSPSPDTAASESTLVALPVALGVSESGIQGEEREGSSMSTAKMLSVGDLALFLAEQRRSIAAICASIDVAFSGDRHARERQGAVSDRLFTSREVRVVLMAAHASDVAAQLLDGLDYIEGMLRSQLTAAIGKELTADDFDEYVIHHNKKLFKPEFVPVPFCYAVRRPGHAPDGSLVIECGTRGGSKPIYTNVASIPSEAPMSFAISASTRVTFVGERRLHALVAQQFGKEPPAPLNLVARARQFSSFLMVVGKMDSADSFEPSSAIILQNKDELTIPLLLHQLPTPAAFRDAIHSLSPEQQRFARAFRNMQLSSSVFGILVIQLKPQLEKVLKLPRDSLTKEIRLTQDLLSLFIDYQVPTDLLTFDQPSEDWEVVGNTGARGGEAKEPALAVEAVKGHVAALKKMIEESKAAELEDQERKADFEKARALHDMGSSGRTTRGGGPAMFRGSMDRGAPPPPPPPSCLVMGGMGAPGARGGMAGIRHASLTHAVEPQLFMACSAKMELQSSPRIEKCGAPPPPPSMPLAASPASQTQRDGQQATEQKLDMNCDDMNCDDESGAADKGTVDVTTVPRKLDARLEALDKDSAVRPTTIKAGTSWTKSTLPHLLGKPVSEVLDSAAQEAEKNKAFDLLDALSLSGALAIEGAELHVIVAATHRFDKALIDTVIADNVSPIDKLERSTMVVASTIHNVPPEQLVLPQHASRAVLALASHRSEI